LLLKIGKDSQPIKSEDPSVFKDFPGSLCNVNLVKDLARNYLILGYIRRPIARDLHVGWPIKNTACWPTISVQISTSAYVMLPNKLLIDVIIERFITWSE